MTTGWFDEATAWFEEQKRLTPDELQNVTFPTTRLGRRGYEQAPVNRFLRQVHAEFVRLVKDRASLWQDVQQLRRRMLVGPADGDEGDILFRQSDVQALSSLAIEEARLGRHGALREAQEHSDMILKDAHAKAREAAVAALNAAAVPQTDGERRAAQAELAYLRAYSSVYREHLRAYTEDVIRGIEEWESKGKEGASLPDAATAEEAALGQAERRSTGQ